MTFKFPSVKRKGHQRASPLIEGLPSFNWEDLSDKEEIGRGSFGSVFVAKYPAKMATSWSSKSCWVLRKKRGVFFSKEAKMLHQLQSPNIVEFKAICFAPTAIMLEYLAFDFAPFGIEEKVNSLQVFLHLKDEQNAVQEFPLQLKISSDVS